MKRNKGITLIALIITIIVLLILVAVSVQILIKSNLIGAAEKATGKYKTASEGEANGGKITVGEKEYDSIDEYLEKGLHNWQYTDETRSLIRCTCSKCKAFDDGDSTGRTLTVGQQIGETQYITASTSITGEKSGYTIWNSTTSQNELVNQTLELDNEETKWVVFGYEDKDNDGRNEVLLLTTEYPTDDSVAFEGIAGYNNGIEEVNRMCKAIYGENARGMTIEDINRVLGYTPEGMYYDSSHKTQTTGNLTTKLKDLGDMWTAIINYNKTKRAGVFYDPNCPEGLSDNGVALGDYELNGYLYFMSDVPANISYIARTMIVGSNRNFSYWLSSRGVTASQHVYVYPDICSAACFGIGYVGGAPSSSSDLFYSTGDSRKCSGRLRPLVSLTSDIPASGEVPPYTTRGLDFKEPSQE